VRAVDWEVVIGMEVHVQPTTRTKMFCSCAIAPLNAPPNTHTCPVCLGLPGVLPVINKSAVEACLKTAVALNCEIPRHTKFDRKNYMYPDLPKGYQISQYDLPMSHDGHLEVGERRVRIRRVHLEEDTGKLVHAGDRLHKAHESFVDLNRAGVPLMEIVSEPDIRSAEEARDYAMALRTMLRTIGASEADMEKGQLRAEPNISVRRTGTTELGVKTELKNINSFRNLHRAIDFEVKRQIEALESGQSVKQETRGWSDAEQRTFAQRTKEFAEDYRYFPEPDLPPLELDPAWIEELRRALPELPEARRARLVAQYALPLHDASLIAAERELADLFEGAVLAGADSKLTANWVIGEIAPRGGGSFANEITPHQLAQLLGLLSSRYLNRDNAQKTLTAIWNTSDEPESVATQKGWIGQVHDDVIENAILEVFETHAQAVADYRSGKRQALGALVRAVRAAAGGNADPSRVSDLLRAKLDA